MDKIVVLSNGIKLGFIGNVYPVMFEDNSIIPEWDNGNPYYIDGKETVVTVINEKTMLIADVIIGLADWIKTEVINFVQALKKKGS